MLLVLNRALKFVLLWLGVSIKVYSTKIWLQQFLLAPFVFSFKKVPILHAHNIDSLVGVAVHKNNRKFKRMFLFFDPPK